jgi:hypothetical protein
MDVVSRDLSVINTGAEFLEVLRQSKETTAVVWFDHFGTYHEKHRTVILDLQEKLPAIKFYQLRPGLVLPDAGGVVGVLLLDGGVIVGQTISLKPEMLLSLLEGFVKK